MCEAGANFRPTYLVGTAFLRRMYYLRTPTLIIRVYCNQYSARSGPIVVRQNRIRPLATCPTLCNAKRLGEPYPRLPSWSVCPRGTVLTRFDVRFPHPSPHPALFYCGNLWRPSVTLVIMSDRKSASLHLLGSLPTEKAKQPLQMPSTHGRGAKSSQAERGLTLLPASGARQWLGLGWRILPRGPQPNRDQNSQICHPGRGSPRFLHRVLRSSLVDRPPTKLHSLPRQARSDGLAWA